MGEEIRVTLLQRAADLDPAVNRAALGEAAEVAGVSDLAVWPEAFARDFGKPGSDLATWAEPLDGPFTHALSTLASTHDVTLLAGMFEDRPDGLPWNTLVLATPTDHASYRKIHLYDSFGYQESAVLSPGEPKPVVVDVNGFKVGLMTCYDLRFPELGRLLVDAGAEIIVVPSAWVAGPRKVDHWRTLVRARAIENTVYVVAVGQPGPRYTGHSMVVAPTGDVVAEAGEGPETLTVTLERDVFDAARRENPSLLNRRL